MSYKNPAGRTADKKGKKGRWSAVDTVILLVVLVCIASLIYRVVYAYERRGGEDGHVICNVTFEVTEVMQDVLETVDPFDALYLYGSGERLGYIGVYVDDQGQQKVALTVVGTAASGDTRVRAEGCMVCAGNVLADGCLLVDGTDLYIAPGSELTVCSERALLTIRVTGITPKE